MPPDTINAKITYLLPPPDGARAFETINSDPKTGERERNITRVIHDLPVENIRGKEHLYTLDNAGFQFYYHPTSHSEFRDDKKVEEYYYIESAELVKGFTGASRVVVFDHTHRLRRPGEIDSSPQRRQPIPQAHVDHTTASSIARVHRHLPPSEVPSLLLRRFQIINLWRPIKNPAHDWPLALCDYRSVDPNNDTFPVALVYPSGEGETMGIKHNLNHQWKYIRGMSPDEVILIKWSALYPLNLGSSVFLRCFDADGAPLCLVYIYSFDSLQDGSVAVFSPHTGFEDPTTPEGSPLRESIELRFLVFYD